MYHNDTDSLHLYSDLQEPRLDVDGLQPSAPYDLRVRARSSGGIGPWSDWFNGQTLDHGEKPRRIGISKSVSLATSCRA